MPMKFFIFLFFVQNAFATAQIANARVDLQTIDNIVFEEAKSTRPKINRSGKIFKASSQGINSKTEFVCKVNKFTKIKNKEVLADRKFMLSYKPQTANDSQHIKMIASLMKYRMLKGKNSPKPYYASSARWGAGKGVYKTINKWAKAYYKQYGAPKNCVITNIKQSNIAVLKKVEISSPECLKEIKLRVQTIPAPLVATQASIESTWGASEQAQNENNILGLQVKFNQPETMSKYKYCRRAKKDRSRCILKFDSYLGSIHEYFARFNSSSNPGYIDYRKKRKSTLAKPRAINVNASDNNSCDVSKDVSLSLNFYAEDKNYANKLKRSVVSICKRLQKCDSLGKPKPAINI